MKAVLFFAEWKLEGWVIVYVWTSIWSIYFTLDMLNVLFRSAVGKRREQYIASCTMMQRISMTYIPKVTSYHLKLSRYLIYNYIAIWITSAIMIALLVVWRIVPVYFQFLIKCYMALIIVVIFIPPYIISFILTRYRGGHPCYEFDLDTKFVKTKQKLKKQKLMHEKKNSLLLTPEEFALQNRNKSYK